MSFAFWENLHKCMSVCGLDSSRYKGHSFCIGAASLEAEKGLSVSQIRAMGRWNSNAFRKYIRSNYMSWDLTDTPTRMIPAWAGIIALPSCHLLHYSGFIFLLFESIHFNLLNIWHYWCYPVVTTMYEILSLAWDGDLYLIWQIICFCLQCYFINQWCCVGVITLPAWAGIVFITLCISHVSWHSWYCS